MAKKGIFSRTVALTVLFGPMVLLFLAAFYNALSLREWAIGMLVWIAVIFVFAIVRKLSTRKTLASTVAPIVEIDESARRRTFRRIWLNKITIGLLVILIPWGIANGVTHRAWLPTLVGVAIDLLLIYIAAEEIRRWRRILDSPRE